jgi:hypothetical protein
MGWYRSSRKGAPIKAKYHRLSAVWTTYTPRQERKYRQARAFSIRGQWKYSRNRTEEREQQVKRSVKAVVGINRWVNNLWGWIAKKLGIKSFKPQRIDPDIYKVEVGDYEPRLTSF